MSRIMSLLLMIILIINILEDQAPIIILSNNQRHPRGRRGKKWVNFQGSSLGFSLCLKFNRSLSEYKILSQLVGVSIIESCEILGNKSLKIKWPNDIMQGDKKVCGTLIENLLSSDKSLLLNDWLWDLIYVYLMI